MCNLSFKFFRKFILFNFCKTEKKFLISIFYLENLNSKFQISEYFYTKILLNFETQKYVINSYDICDNYAPSVLENIDRGFIHSPYYPDYYLNNRNCYIGIKIPNDKRLVVYLMRRSMEDKSIFRNSPKDFVGIEDGFKYFGFSNVPEIIYDGNDREEVYVNFVSDWITTQFLRSPKGFLIYFELFAIHQLVTSEPLVFTSQLTTTTTSTTTTPVSTTSFVTTTPVEVKIQEVKLIPETISEKMHGNDFIRKEEDRLMTIITLLIGIIGFLILTIFGLLFSFRKKSKQQSEEDTIYDMNDSKSVHSGHYNDEYQNVSIISTISLNRETPCKNKNLSKKKQTFNETLRKFYKNLNKTLNISRNLLQSDNFLGKDMNSTINLDKTNIYSPNEFNLNESNAKVESNVPLDKLKFFKSSASLAKKQTETEVRRDLNRSENLYVTIEAVRPNLETKTEDGKLEIYEVNFDDNFAYLTPSSKPSSPSKNQDYDIYHSINDYGNDCRELLKEQMIKSSQCLNEEIYSMPNNKEIKSNEEHLTCSNSDNSVINLLICPEFSKKFKRHYTNIFIIQQEQCCLVTHVNFQRLNFISSQKSLTKLYNLTAREKKIETLAAIVLKISWSSTKYNIQEIFQKGYKTCFKLI
ncbi:hypothetical protein BpHYR1_030561 [Brachionus plicatilis]|uniref:CUB domain-containing protein n=1 Tax=Brachionus plicatilis TaxID=10195 RepID=A0A3M7SRK4_BRAPC|nr:hypothetical protein BpHYR1_030561 [Brachionus plicatilis]